MKKKTQQPRRPIEMVFYFSHIMYEENILKDQGPVIQTNDVVS